VAGRASSRKKLLLQNMTCKQAAALPPRVLVGRFRPMCAVLLPVIVQYVNNGGGRCGVLPVRDDA